MGEVLTQVWQLFDKQVNAQKEKTSGAHVSSRKPTKKVCDENESRKKMTGA